MFKSHQRYLKVSLQPSESEEPIQLAYLDHAPASPFRAILLLIHGFPQTSYQYRHVLPLLTAQGYRCIVPDYRGAGASSHPATSPAAFRKSTMARDFIALLDCLQITEKVHVIGHDIGGMIAWSLAARFPERVKSVVWGECALPGTTAYYKDRWDHAVQQFHFIFHSVPDLPEALIAGRERLYICHFLDKITYNMDAFSEEDIDVYVAAYERPGAMRCALGVYRAFEADAKENEAWVREQGKCKVPTLILSGGKSRHRMDAKDMALEVTEENCSEVGEVSAAGHYIAEENPEGFAKVVGDFVSKHI